MKNSVDLNAGTTASFEFFKNHGKAKIVIFFEYDGKMIYRVICFINIALENFVLL